jgi:hypothetical protein
MGRPTATALAHGDHDLLHVAAAGDLEDAAFLLKYPVVGHVAVDRPQWQITHDVQALGFPGRDHFFNFGGPAPGPQHQHTFLENIGLVPLHEQEPDQDRAQSRQGDAGDEFPAHREGEGEQRTAQRQ